MPVYEYECRCGNLFEKIFTTISSVENTVRCEKCASIAKKIVSQSSFALKGDCWMRDSYTRTGLPRRGKT